MLITVPAKQFTAAVNNVIGVVPGKTTVPILAGIQIMPTSPTSIALSAYDYTMSAQTHVVDAEVDAGEMVVVSGRGLHNVTKVLPNTNTVELALQGSRLAIAAGSTVFELPILPADTYPMLPCGDTVLGEVGLSALSAAVRRVSHAAKHSEDGLTPLGCVLLRIEGNHMIVAATNAHQIAEDQVTWVPAASCTDRDMLIPVSQMVNILEAMPNDDYALVRVVANREGSLFGLMDAAGSVHTTVTDLQFPNYTKLFTDPGDERATTITVDTKTMLESLRRVKTVLGKDASPFVTIDFDSDSAAIEVEGTIHDELEIQGGREAVTFRVNVGLLAETLATFRTEQVVLVFPSNRMVTIVSTDDSPYRATLAGGGEPK